MDIASISSAAAGSQAASDRRTIAENFDAFLSLLTTQLKNQNPLEPLDTNEFTAQLVQFTSVEQSIKTNQNLEQLLALSLSNAMNGMVSYLGKTVTAEGATSELRDGKAVWNYTLAADAPVARVSISNAQGQTVFAQTLALSAGAGQYTWDGRLDDGTTAPDGTYTIAIEAVDAQGNAVAASTRVQGVVTGLDMSTAEPTFTVNGSQVKLSAIKTVSIE